MIFSKPGVYEPTNSSLAVEYKQLDSVRAADTAT